MQFAIMKTGLDIFDAARAWGLAIILSSCQKSEVCIRDQGWCFWIKLVDNELEWRDPDSTWEIPIDDSDENWSFVFTTLGQEARKQKVYRIKSILKNDLCREVLEKNFAIDAEAMVFVKGGESLPGGLDPSAFKGVRQKTRARYEEDQLKIEKHHWALACLGMALCGSYQRIGSTGIQRTIGLLPIPYDVTLSQWAEVQELTRWQRSSKSTAQQDTGLSKQVGGTTVAAQAAVQLAERIRKRAAAQGSLRDRFSEIAFFELFKTSHQPKPAQGNRVQLDRLTQIILGSPKQAEEIFAWLDYCFRRGSKKGAQDLALAATEFIFRWDLESYYRLVYIFVRYLADNEIAMEKRPNEEAMKEVLRYVTI